MKKNILIFLKAILVYFAVLIYCGYFLNNSSYNILVTLLFFFIWWFFSIFPIKQNEIGKKEQKLTIILSIIITGCLTFGNIGMHIYSQPNISNLRIILYTILMFTGLFILFAHLFIYVFLKTKKISLIEKSQKLSKKWIIIIFMSIFLSSMIYFLRFYPAIMTPDSYYVIKYADSFILNDFHTFGHTWFFGIPFHLGKLLFHNLNMAVAFAMIFQVLCICAIITIVIKYFYEKGVNKKIIILLVIIYALNPLYAHYSITLWRDVMFGTAFLLLLICLFEFITSDIIAKKYFWYFIIAIISILFFRNNGIYVYLFMIPFIIWGIKKHQKILSIVCITLLVFYIIVKGPIFNYFNIAKTTSVEAFSIPLQQIARVVAKEKYVSGKDREFLEKLWDYDKVPETYLPSISDPIKNLTNQDILNDNKLSFFRTYLHLLIKYPKIYIEAYMFQTAGYWYPDIIYWATGGESKSIFPEENVYSKSLVPNWYKSAIDITTERSLPFANLIWSVGLMFLLLVISTFMTIYRNKKYFVCYIPLYGLWLSIMASTPVFCELRYVYGIFFCMPIIIILPLIIKEGSKKND